MMEVVGVTSVAVVGCSCCCFGAGLDTDCDCDDDGFVDGVCFFLKKENSVPCFFPLLLLLVAFFFAVAVGAMLV